jgi:iron complex transport system ATP-binding protein
VTGETTLRAHGISVVLGGSQILEDISFDLRSGEVTVLVGPNGAGKSTLFSVLAGDLTPTAGSVQIVGGDRGAEPGSRELFPVDSLRPKELSRRRAVQMQETRLAFAYTAYDTVEMGRAPWEGTAEESRDEEVIATAMEAAEVAHLSARHVPGLSGGERARVAFARLIAQETELLLLDEPTAALDIRHQERVIAVARDRARAGATVLVIVHDLSLAAAYADRIIMLDRGTLRADGTPAEVLSPELISEVYDHPVTVITAPGSGELLVIPQRVPLSGARAAARTDPPRTTASRHDSLELPA